MTGLDLSARTVSVDPERVAISDKTFQARRGYDDTKLSNLADDMGAFGQRAPIGVRAHPDNTGEFQPIYGFHRTKAARKLGWETVEATVYEDIDDATALELSIRDNSMHEDLGKVEKARQAAELKADGWSVEELCAAYNTNKSAVYNWLNVVELRDEVLAFIEHDVLTLSHGVELSKVDDDSRRLELTEMAVGYDLSVRELNSQRTNPDDPAAVHELPAIKKPMNGAVHVCPLDLAPKSMAGDCAGCPYADDVELVDTGHERGDGTQIKHGKRVECGGFTASDQPREVLKAVQTLWLESAFLRETPGGEILDGAVGVEQ